MNDTVRLGRIWGIPVGLNWSLLVMVALVAGGLAESRFPAEAPGYGGGAYAVAGLLTAVGLLVGVLLHELGHALVARRRRLPVDGITLSWMGGVTRIGPDTGSAVNELLVSVIGPAVSAAVGGMLLAGRLGAEAAGAGRLTLAALAWLGGINLVLAAFNLLPASPLDGGRVLHGLVWLLGRNRWWATRIASGAGVVLGLGFVGAGLLMSESSRFGLLNGLVIGFIGWWMFASARIELGSGALARTLEGVRAADVMRPVGDAPGWVTIRTFVERYAAGRPGWVWLLRGWDGGYAGFVAGDELGRVPLPQWDVLRPLDVGAPVAAAVGAAPDEAVLDLLARTSGRRPAFVIDGDRTLGMVLPSDVAALVRMGHRPASGWRPVAGPVR
jgi:Zn-dependent protease